MKDKLTRISELQALTKKRLIVKARILGLKFNGSKPDLIEKIYEIEISKANKRIDEIFNKVPKPKLEIMNKKRMRDDDDDDDESMVSSKSQKLK